MCHTPLMKESKCLRHFSHHLAGFSLGKPLPLLDVGQQWTSGHLVKHKVKTEEEMRTGTLTLNHRSLVYDGQKLNPLV